MPDRDAPAVIERLARGGVHMVIDKPAALTSAAARQAFDAVRDHGVRTVVGLTRRYSPAARAARAVIETGRLGTLVTAEAIFATSTVRVREPANHLFDPARSAGGLFAWLGIHDLDTLPWLIGEPVGGGVGHDRARGRSGARRRRTWRSWRCASRAVPWRPSRTRTRCPPAGYRTRFAIRGLDASLELGPARRSRSSPPATTA